MSKTAKKFLAVFFVLFFIVFLTIIVMLASPGEVVTDEGRIGLIHLAGPIQDGYSSFGSSGITPGYVADRLDRARSENVEAVVLRINSPGGSVAASQEIARMIENFEKPVVISMGDMAASGGYYISAPADRIIARPGTQTGSIGVIMQLINPEGLLEKLGLETETITSGEHKDMFTRELTEKERQLIQDLSDEAYGQFINEIMEGREFSEEEVKQIATGEIFIGSQAYELGLIDELGGFDEALEAAGRLAGIEEPVYYELPEPSLFTQIWGVTASLPDIIRKLIYSEEMAVLEQLEQGLNRGLEYRVPGY